MNSIVPFFVILPLAAAFIIPIAGKFVRDFQKAITSLTLLALTGLSFYVLLANRLPLTYLVGGWEPVKNVPVGIHLYIDGLSVFVLLIINLIGFLSAFYSISYMKRYTGENNYYTLFCLMIAGMNGVAVTGDIFNLYVFLEIAAIASYTLVAFGVEKEELEASFKYQVLGGTASLLVLFSIGMIYWHTKTLNIADISRFMIDKNSTPLIGFIQVFLIAGFGLKAAMIPFHAWLPDAHSSAPSPISCMLSGVVIKAIGVYVIIRLFFNMFVLTYKISLIITIIGALSMLIGVLLAIGQWDIKRLLAYHSISQMGYVVVAVGAGMLILVRENNVTVAALSISGGLYHMINHAVFKGLLFLNAGAVEYRTGTRNMRELGGLASSMPITRATSFAASMAISGIPPFNGFFSKLIIIIALIKANYYTLAFLAVFVSIITLASFLKVQRFTFYNASDEKWKKDNVSTIKEAPFSMCFSMITLAVLCLVLSLLIFPSFSELVLNPAVNALMGLMNYYKFAVG